MKNFYISVVIVGRNDDYGVNFLDRLKLFVRHLDKQLFGRENLMELIIVEYNPLPDKPKLYEVLQPTNNLHVRIITVPEAVHLTTGRAAPVLEWYGKNVGARRATGEFILLTNPDIVFTDQLINELSLKNLEKDVLYRTDRYDYIGNDLDTVSLDDTIDYAISNTFAVHKYPETATIKNTKNFDSLLKTNVFEVQSPFTNASGDFILTARENYINSKGICFECDPAQGHTDSFSVFRLIFVNNLRQHVFVAPLCIFHMDHERKPNKIPWVPQMAYLATNWPSMFSNDWGFGNFNLEERDLKK